MSQGQSARVIGLGKVDPIFSRMRVEAEETVRKEPELAGFFMASVLNHETLESAIVHRVAARLQPPVRPQLLRRRLSRRSCCVVRGRRLRHRHHRRRRRRLRP